MLSEISCSNSEENEKFESQNSHENSPSSDSILAKIRNEFRTHSEYALVQEDDSVSKNSELLIKKSDDN